MRNFHRIRTEWPIAVVAALVLIVAGVVGAYGHAAGHGHHEPPRMAHAASGAVAFVAQPVDVGGGHEGADTVNAHAGCYDFVCHGGHAMLAEPLVISHPLRCALDIPPAPALSSTQPNRLERPPRYPVFA